MKNNHNKTDLAINNNAPSFGFVSWDLVTDTITMCPYLAKTLAFKTEDITQTYDACLKLVHPDDLSQIEQLVRALKQQETPYIVTESRELCRDGNWRWFSFRGKVTKYDYSGNPVQGTGICTDITHSKENEKKLSQMELLFSETNRIKAYLDADYSLTDIYIEIVKSFEKFTNTSNSTFIFSFIVNADEFNINNTILHDINESIIDNATLSFDKLKLIGLLLHNKKNIIHNDNKKSTLCIYFNLPFMEQGLLIIERDEPFNEKFLDFLKPLINTAAHIISIKKLESNHSELDRFLSFFINQVPAPVAMFDRNMRYKFASDAWRSSFMIDHPDDFIGKCFYDLFPNTPEVWRKRHQAALQGEIQLYVSEKATHIIKEPVWLEGCMHPWYALDGSIGGIIVYSTIITKRIEAERNMKNLVDNLSRSNQALDRFAHVCSHDLKEPLRSVSNFIQLLFNHNSGQFDEESLLYMSHALKGTERMNTLIKDILSYSEIIEQTACEKNHLNMNDIMSEIKETFDYKLREINAQLNISALPMIPGNKTQISQLFTNLVSNAIKFHSEKPLVIEIFAINRDDFWEFHVRDNGIGIAPEYYKDIFGMFKRLHSKNKYEGSGIGLATCQKIVHDHDGEIFVQSAPEGGSEFIFTFPKIRI